MKELFRRYWLHIVLIAALVIAYPIAYFNTAKVITIKVKGKERIAVGAGESISSKFIVYTYEGVYENTDSFVFGKFNSADFQNELEVCEKYRVKVAGWRIPFLSMYQNIVEIVK